MISKNLSTLLAGERAKVLELNGAADNKRLKAMGFVEGKTLQILRAGNPFIVKIADTSVGLGRDLAERITVQV